MDAILWPMQVSASSNIEIVGSDDMAEVILEAG
jgi:hypothetical protein